MKYYLEDLQNLSLKELQDELYECESIFELYEFRFPPILKIQGWEEADEIAELREYIEALNDEITDARFLEIEREAV